MTTRTELFRTRVDADDVLLAGTMALGLTGGVPSDAIGEAGGSS
jgi:hypothetical protein